MKHFVWLCLFFWGNVHGEVFLNEEKAALPTGIISQIRFENEDDSLKDTLNSFLLLKEGETFTLQKIEKAKERLMTLGWYHKIDISWEEDENNPREYIINVFLHKNLFSKAYFKFDYISDSGYLYSEAFFRLNRFFSYPFSLSFLAFDHEFYRKLELKSLYIKDYEYSYGFNFNLEHYEMSGDFKDINFYDEYYKNESLLHYKKSFLDIFEATFYLGAINIFDDVEYGYWTVGLSAQYNHFVKQGFFEEGVLWDIDIQHGWTEKYHESPFSRYTLSLKWGYLPFPDISLHGYISLETIETVSPYWDNSLLKIDLKILSKFRNDVLLGTRTFLMHHELSYLIDHREDFYLMFSLYGENLWMGHSQHHLLKSYEDHIFSRHGVGSEILWRWRGWNGHFGYGAKYHEGLKFLGYTHFSYSFE